MLSEKGKPDEGMHRGASVEISLLKLNLPPALHALLSKGDIIGDITAHCVVKFNNNRGAIAAHRHADLIAPYRPLSSIRQFDRRLLPHVDAQALGSLADRRRLAQRIQQMAIGPQYRERSARILMDVDTMAVDPRRRIVTEDALVTKSEEEEYWSSDESGDETSLPAGPAKPMLPSIRRIDARSSTLLEKRKRRELLAAAFVQNPDPSREQLNELTERIGGTFNANKTWVHLFHSSLCET